MTSEVLVLKVWSLRVTGGGGTFEKWRLAGILRSLGGVPLKGVMVFYPIFYAILALSLPALSFVVLLVCFTMFS